LARRAERRSIAVVWDEAGASAARAGLALNEARIADVIVCDKFRPTRATWQKLIDAKLPMCSWEEASESWDLSEAQRDLEREQK
jgi:hypothetical protein